MNGHRRHLRNRLMLAFAGFTIVVATLFGLYVAMFAYSVEDLFFTRILDREAQTQQQHHARTGRWAQPHEPFITVIADASALPEDLPARLAAEPQRREFGGAQGHHYHLRPLAATDTQGTADATAQDGPAWLVAEVSEELVIRPRRAALFQWLAWSGAAVVALALLLGGWLAQRTAAPLSRLASLVDRSHPTRLPTSFAAGFPNDEVGVLAHALESLIGRVDDVIAREREFTRDASHELRTPLAVIRGACEQLAGETSLSIAGRQYLEHVRQSAWQLEQTVTTLLSLAREEWQAGTATAVAILPVLERVIVEQATLIDGRPVDVDTQVPGDARLTVPSPVLHILLSNLVGNAFAHTPRGRIRIDVEHGRLRIANPGGAIRDADFEPHVRGASSAGFGLGLAIVRRLCERHDIDLEIETQTATDGTGDPGINTTVASLALDPNPGPAA